MPLTVVVRPKARIVRRFNTGIVGSNSSRLCVSLARCFSCVGRGLRMGRSPIQGVLPIFCNILGIES
jgi:hypothetical protein